MPLRVSAAAHDERSAALDRRTLLAAGASAGLLLASPGARAAPASVWDFTVEQYGKPFSMDAFKGQVLVVNVNYPGLRYLYDKYHADGFNLVAFPCNQFGGQAPGTSDEERAWAYRKFGFEFPCMDKLEVNGRGAHPLYKFMREQQPISLPNSTGPPPGEPGRIEWNYTKFLISRDGQAVKRYKSAFNPAEFEGDIQLLLAGKEPLPAECVSHPGRKVCNVEALLTQA